MVFTLSIDAIVYPIKYPVKEFPLSPTYKAILFSTSAITFKVLPEDKETTPEVCDVP
jgi:hypothetical protein